MISRRRALASLAGMAVRPTEKPSFLILHTDDQRFDTLRALGNQEIHTPNMDRLVVRGVAFTQASTQGGLIGAICAPSRAQMLTGHNVFRVHQGIVDRPATPDPAMVTFPEHLRTLGYATFHSGKWHLGPALHHRSFSAGAEIFFGGMSSHDKMPVLPFDPSGKYPQAQARPANGFSSEVISGAAIQFLKDRDAAKPFLLYAAFTSPHDPRMAPQRFADLYAPDKLSLPKNFLPQHPFDNGELKVRDELLAPFPRTEADVRKQLAAYYAMISEVDFHIGRVLDALDSSDAAQNTYVIFAGDNGLAVGQHGLFGKQNMYDHSLRVPLVIAGPDVPKGRRNDALCHLMDIAPTVCRLAGKPLAANVDGQDLLRTVTRRETIAAYRDVQRCIRTTDWKLIRYRVSGRETIQLFDLQRDPWEMSNLAAERKHAGRVQEMTALLQRRLREASDPLA